MKFTKPDNLTTGSNRKCLRCFKCKCRTFFSIETLKYWCVKREVHYNIRWERKIVKCGEVQLTWCELQPRKVRMFRRCSTPFIEDCEEKVARRTTFN